MTASVLPPVPSTTAASPRVALPPPDRHDDRISTALSAREWTVGVEQSAVYRLAITNGGDRGATFVVGVEGLAPDWVAISSPVVYLNRNERAMVTITVTPPRSPCSRAGVHHWAVVVTSPDYPGRWSRHGATLIIKPYREFSLGGLTPRRQTLSWFAHSGRTLLSITNESNCETLFRLEGADEAGDCQFEFRVPGEPTSRAGQLELRMQPGETLAVPVRITPLSRRLIGLGKETHFCTITTTMLGARPRQRAVLVQLRRAPLIGSGLTVLVVVCLVGLLLRQTGSYVAAEFEMAPPQAVSTRSESYSLEKTPPAVAFVENSAREADTGATTYKELFQEAARQYDLDWQLLAYLAYRESSLEAQAIGEANETGLMQILPSTWDEWAPKVGVTDPLDPRSNVLVAAAYLAYLREYCTSKGYPEDYWVLAAYNWGPDNLRRVFENKGGWARVPEKTRRYVVDILQAEEGGLVSPAVFDGTVPP